MTGSRKILASNLERLIKASGLQKQEVARRAGMGHPSELTPYLKGARDAGIDQLDRLADALGTTPAALLDDGSAAPAVTHESFPLDECARRVTDAAAMWEAAKEVLRDGTTPTADVAALERVLTRLAAMRKKPA